MRLMCIMNQNIFNVKSGGGQCALRNYESIKAIVEENDDLYTCVISPEITHVSNNDKELYIPGLVGSLQSALATLWGCKCYKKKYEKVIWQFIDQVKPDVIYIDTSKLGKLSKRIKKKYKTRIIYFFHNVESDYSMNLVKNRGFQYLLSYWTSLYNEKMALKYGDAFACLTQRDSARINEIYRRRVDTIIPISFKDRFDASRVAIDERNDLLFVGSLFPPNYDGVKWFVENVMSELPDKILTIVGKDFERKRGELERENVKVIGTVENTDEFYYTYPYMVMPIPYGAGMKVKTAEAMMFGKIIFATDEALEGYSIESVEGIYRCNTADEFIYNIRLFTQKDQKYMSDRIREVFLSNYEFEVTKEQFKKRLKA